MKTYILFIFGAFEDHEDLEFFCMEHFSQVSEKGIKYVIENGGNTVIIFESDKDKETLVDDLKKTLSIEHIKFYFMFEKEKIFWAELPDSIANFIFKPQESQDDAFKITIRKLDKNYDIDVLLDKIQEFGFDSLNDDEKYFLDNFGK
jgi:tRNA(Ser,Leu) C12 N-acetylase TAN1